MMTFLDGEHGYEASALPAPAQLMRLLPVAGTPVAALVAQTRAAVRRILHGHDDRLLVIVGPCSIHDPAAALEYAQRLGVERERHAGALEIVMRVYFEKPRTTVGWKGLINDPYLDASFRVRDGLYIARKLLVDIHRHGVPAAGEFLDTISPQYIGDLFSWGAIGARTTESQIHRELASNHKTPVGFKNGTDGNFRIAVDAIRTAARPHHFLSIHDDGQVAALRTRGNPDCHLILRGGKTPNYDAASVASACHDLQAAGLGTRLMVDLSHGNSGKDFERQREVARHVGAQVAEGCQRISGVMIESHLHSGAQSLVPGRDDPGALAYGRSITDGCIGWQDTTAMLDVLHAAVVARRHACDADPARAGRRLPCINEVVIGFGR